MNILNLSFSRARFVKAYKLDLISILLLTLTAPLFFYKLGQSSLVSWDEAWYGGIAKNIIYTGDLFNLQFNGSAYNDHPPVGFWLIALCMKIFGESDWSVRALPAVAGLISIYLIYILGKQLFNRTVGFASGLALSSTFWFTSRARSGNLDSILVLFFLLTLVLAIQATKNKKFLPIFGMSFSLLILTKSMVPFTIIPALVVIFWNTGKYQIRQILLTFGVVILLPLIWLIAQLTTQETFLSHYFLIGLPGVGVSNPWLENLKLAKEYLHNGIGKWFWPGIGALAVSLITRQKRFILLTVFFVAFFVPFIFSSKGHIWHLVPLYPVMILSFFGLLDLVVKIFLRKTMIVNVVVIGVALYLSFFQYKIMWYQFIDIPAFISDEAILSREAAKYPQKFIIDGDFVPTAAYYSGKTVAKVSENQLTDKFLTNNGFVMITYKWRLDSLNIPEDQYQILKTDRDKILILRLPDMNRAVSN